MIRDDRPKPPARADERASSDPTDYAARQQFGALRDRSADRDNDGSDEQ
jgi:hypothetical protein